MNCQIRRLGFIPLEKFPELHLSQSSAPESLLYMGKSWHENLPLSWHRQVFALSLGWLEVSTQKLISVLWMQVEKHWLFWGAGWM